MDTLRISINYIKIELGANAGPTAYSRQLFGARLLQIRASLLPPSVDSQNGAVVSAIRLRQRPRAARQCSMKQGEFLRGQRPQFGFGLKAAGEFGGCLAFVR